MGMTAKIPYDYELISEQVVDRYNFVTASQHFVLCIFLHDRPVRPENMNSLDNRKRQSWCFINVFNVYFYFALPMMIEIC